MSIFGQGLPADVGSVGFKLVPCKMKFENTDMLISLSLPMCRADYTVPIYVYSWVTISRLLPSFCFTRVLKSLINESAFQYLLPTLELSLLIYLAFRNVFFLFFRFKHQYNFATKMEKVNHLGSRAGIRTHNLST